MAERGGIRAGRAYVTVGAQPDMQRGLKASEMQVRKFGFRMRAMSTAIGNLMAQGFSAGLQAVGAGVSGTVQRLRELEKANQMLEVRFGENTERARKLAKSFQFISTTKAIETLSSMQAKMKAWGMSAEDAQETSMQLASGIDDLARTTSYTAEEIIEKMISGLNGESAAIDNLDINLKMAALAQTDYAKSLGLTAGKMTEQQKRAAMLEQIYKRLEEAAKESSKAESNSITEQMALANEWQNFMDQLSKASDSVLADLLTLLRMMLEQFNLLIGGTAGFGDAAATVFYTLAAWVEILIKRFGLLVAAMDNAKKGNLALAAVNASAAMKMPSAMELVNAGAKFRERLKDFRQRKADAAAAARPELDLQGAIKALPQSVAKAAKKMSFLSAPTAVMAGTSEAMDKRRKIQEQFEKIMFDREAELLEKNNELLGEVAMKLDNLGVVMG